MVYFSANFMRLIFLKIVKLFSNATGLFEFQTLGNVMNGSLSVGYFAIGWENTSLIRFFS